MSGEVTLANAAITKVGGTRILALSDNTKEARECNARLAQVRDAELRKRNWKFALVRVELSAEVASPVWGYTYQYPMPADCLRLVQVNDFYVRPYDKQTPMWSVESRKILTNIAAPLRIKYVQRVDNPGSLDPLFFELVATMLAFEICDALTQSGRRKQALMEEYRMRLSDATAADAFENPPDELAWGSWLDARESGNGWLTTGGPYPFGSGFTVL